MAEEGPGGRVGPAGGLGWGEVFASAVLVLVVVGGGWRVGACALFLGNICFSAEPLHWFEHFDYLKACTSRY